MALNSRSTTTERNATSLPSFHIKEQNRWERSSLEQNYKVMYHTITSLRVVFGLSTPSTDGLDQRSLRRERKFRSRVENFQGRV